MKHTYHEKDFQTKFTRWLNYCYIEGSGLFELKVTHGGRALPFKAVQEHQVAALLAAKHNKLVYKIPDDSIGIKPSDCFILSQSRAYVVIQYYQQGMSHEFVMIDIDDFVKERDTSDVKSLTRTRATQIGVLIKMGGENTNQYYKMSANRYKPKY